MRDILGREINEGDICVGKGSGRNVYGMQLGIWNGNSIAYPDGTHRSMRDIFVVVNPTKEELAIKQSIITKLEEKKNKKKEKDNIKTIPLKELVVGGVYKAINDCLYVYLGKKKVTLQDVGYDSDYYIDKEGYCFCHIYEYHENIDYGIADIIDIYCYSKETNVSVLKGNKKLVEKVGQIENIQFPIFYKTMHKQYYYNDLILKIEETS